VVQSTPDESQIAAARVALSKLVRISERIVREEGLTPSRYLLLVMLRTSAGGRSTLTELAERMKRAQSTISELVARAETAGLIWREKAPDDARVTWLRLTDEGERRLTRSFERIAKERSRTLNMLLGERANGGRPDDRFGLT
jgi:DNA-binding MarR family transcriptional regulator